MPGTLYIVATPIGNYSDITFRAIRVLKESDILVCEEFTEGKRFLNKLGIHKELYNLNEHNEEITSEFLIKELLEGKNISYFSDCGTPVFSDPGNKLINLAYANKIKVSAVPGTNSLTSSLVASGFNISKFYYAGWLSPKREIRLKEIAGLKSIKEVIAVMETPYRLNALLEDFSLVFDCDTEICISCDITTENERFYRGTIKDLKEELSQKKEKFEFVFLINNTGKKSLS